MFFRFIEVERAG